MNQKILLVLILSSIFLVSCSIIEMPKDVTGNVVATPVSCVDSDGGQTFETAGTATITYSDGTTKVGGRDACICSKLLKEYYCSGRSVATKTQACNSCVNGACVGGTAPASVACTDTDGGNNLQVYGEVRICGGSTYKDTCAMKNQDNPGDTAVANCDGDGVRCKLQEKYCAADGTGVHANNIVPIGSRCVNGAIVADPCPPVTTRSCTNGDIYETVTRCGVQSSNTLITDCQQGCVMQNNAPICSENCAEEKTYECANWNIFEVTRRCGSEISRTQLNWNDRDKCENNMLYSLRCQGNIASWNAMNWNTDCQIFGCSADGKRCCNPVQDNLQVVTPAYCDGNTFVNATYIGCDGQLKVPGNTDCSTVQIWTNGGQQNVPGQCQTVEGNMDCFACGHSYCVKGSSYVVKWGNENCWQGYTDVNITCA